MHTQILLFSNILPQIGKETQNNNFLGLVYHLFYEMELHLLSSKYPEKYDGKDSS